MTRTWIPLESNPEVLTEFAGKLGLDSTKWQFSDVFGLDPELLEMVPKPVKAVLMCFPITEEIEKAAKAEDEEQSSKSLSSSDKVYYMKQTIGNACGTIAVIHSIANNQEDMKPGEGSFLSQFLPATSSMSPKERGSYLEKPPSGAPDIEQAHQAAAVKGDTAAPPEDEDVNLHFVAFVHRDGKLWQLDGRRAGPVCHGPTSPDTLLQDTVAVVKQFIERTNSLNFNLITLSAVDAADNV